MPNALFSQALAAHARHDLDAAEVCYRHVLAGDPAHAAARHYLGFLLQQSDRLAEATAQLQAAIAAQPGHAEWHFNLGITLARRGDAAGAALAFESAVRLDPRGYLYWTNLGSCRERLGQPAAAEHCYLEAVQLARDRPDAHFLLAALYLQIGRHDEARRHNYLGIVCEPLEGKSRTLRVQALHALGRVEAARALLADWQRQEPDNVVAQHLLQAVGDGAGPERCSADYVAATFDHFAGQFDATLARLGYCGPQRLAALLDEVDPAAGALAVLDLGCGTGLAGAVLQLRAQRLVGVDLSSAMLARASARGIYHALHRADVETWLAGATECFDLITCIDTLIYFGRLDHLFIAMAARLRPGGRLVFSTEARQQAGAPGYQILANGRYTHHPDDLQCWLAAAGLVVDQLQACVIRIEAGCPVHGHLISAVTARAP